MKKSTQRRKNQGYLLPEIINPDDNICVCVPVPNDPGHIRAFLGQIHYLTQWLTWEKETTKSGKLAAARWRDIYECVVAEVEHAMASNCGCGCNDPVLYRFNPDTGRLEQSTDGGETWTEAPDSRFDSPLLPPVLGDTVTDTKCLAAANAVEYFKTQLIDQANSWTTLSTVVAGIIGIIAVLLTGGVASVLAVTLGSIFINAGIAATVAAFTSDVYIRFKCNLYCNAQNDGSWTEADIAAIRAQLDIDETSVALSVLQGWLDQLGPAGLTNSGRLHLITDANCEDCDCDEGCADPDNFTFGTITSSVANPDGSVTFELNSEAAPDSTHVVAWKQYQVKEECCEILEFTIHTTGGTPEFYFSFCTDEEGTFNTNFNFPGGCMFFAQVIQNFNLTAPFTATVTIGAACP